MSQENVEMLRRSYAEYNAALRAPNPPEAIRAAVERFADPAIEWDAGATALTTRIYHGVDGVIEFFDTVLDAFEQVRQVPERFIDCGDQVVVFVRTEARARTVDLEVDELWAHLVTVRNGKVTRVEQFRNRDEALEAAGLGE